jgi:AcrR family transcriptional regulator
MNSRRPYSMTLRAERASATRQRILEATRSLIPSPSGDFTLEGVAEAAGTSVQTVLRTFGSKNDLIRAAIGSTRLPERRNSSTGDVKAAVEALFNDYEQIGERVIWMLAEEHRIPELEEVAQNGRDTHRRWLEQTFAPHLKTLRGAPRKRTLLALVAATDIYVWKLLRLDLGVNRTDSEAIVLRLVTGAIAPEPKEK